MFLLVGLQMHGSSICLSVYALVWFYPYVCLYMRMYVSACQHTNPRVVNLGTTKKLCLRNFVPKPHPGHVVVVSRPNIR